MRIFMLVHWAFGSVWPRSLEEKMKFVSISLISAFQKCLIISDTASLIQAQFVVFAIFFSFEMVIGLIPVY